MRSIMGGLMQIETISEVPANVLKNNVDIAGIDNWFGGQYRIAQMSNACEGKGSRENSFTIVNLQDAPKTDSDLMSHYEREPVVLSGNNDHFVTPNIDYKAIYAGNNICLAMNYEEGMMSFAGFK